MAATKLRTAIILAGGLGTRLRQSVPDLPKCMAPVAGRPFLFYVINYLRSQGIEEFIFSLGYRHEQVEEYLAAEFETLQYQVSIEDEPLLTGGAIRLALNLTSESRVLVTNGDTLFKASVSALNTFHEQHQANCTLALKPMENFDRYGVVTMDENGAVKEFLEKTRYNAGNINGGMYILEREPFCEVNWPQKFSFEKDYLETHPAGLFAQVQDGYFIDIGVPADFDQAQLDLATPPLELSRIDKSWTLFLDRDGVINQDKEGSYIFTPDEFIFSPGAPALFKTLTEVFARIIVVTNQRGIGRNLMTEDTLQEIHEKMKNGIEKSGGRIDAIYSANSIHNDDPFRKPNPGMFLQACLDFPEILPERSLMIGNNLSDMQFARNAGIYAVFVKTTRPFQTLPHPYIDLAFDSLDHFTRRLENSRDNVS